MQNDLLGRINNVYEFMLPQNRETLLLLVNLQSKIESGQMDETFTQYEFDEAVDEVANYLHPGKGINKENISKRLSQYFYTTLKKGNEYRYQLTVFARDMVGLVMNELTPQFDDIELIHTFERTLRLEKNDLESIKKFEYWYANHFQPSKRIILAHTENLQRLVDVRTMSLRQLLKDSFENTKELITGFIEVFEALGKQTRGLADTISFKQDVIENIKDAEPAFTDEREAWDKYTKIRMEVEKFFENIDLRVLSINDRVQAATSRLKTLYDTLRYKQLFKLKLEKFLAYALKSAKHENGEVSLPENIPAKKVPFFRQKMTGIPSLVFSDVAHREVPQLFEDEEYKKKFEALSLRLVNRQEHASKWAEDLIDKFEAGNSLDFGLIFEEIFKEEQNLEVPIDVCYSLIQKYGPTREARLEIERDPVKLDDDFTFWKLKILHPNEAQKGNE